MKRLMLLSTALIFAASMAMAAITADELVAAYQAQGYARIEVKTGPTQIKVEAVTGQTKVEVVYDAATGAILQQETSRASRDDRGTGVEVTSENHDFLADGASNDDHGGDDEMNEDHDDNSGPGSNDDDHDDDHDDGQGDNHNSGESDNDESDADGRSGEGRSGNDD